MNFLLDSNILIYHLNGVRPAADFIRTHAENVVISAITRIETLGFPFPDAHAESAARTLINAIPTLAMSSSIVETTIELRKKRPIKIPDAIIAATALEHNSTLVTRNSSDFQGIANLNILNPFDSN